MLIPIIVGVLETVLGKRIGTGGDRKENWNHLNYSIAEIGQNTQKSPKEQRDLMSLDSCENDGVKN